MAKKVRKDRYGREKTTHMMAVEFREAGRIVSHGLVWLSLKAQGFNNVKPTRKLGLTILMRQQRLAFALRYQYWTIEQWKAVIWTDETSIVLRTPLPCAWKAYVDGFFIENSKLQKEERRGAWASFIHMP